MYYPNPDVFVFVEEEKTLGVRNSTLPNNSSESPKEFLHPRKLWWEDVSDDMRGGNESVVAGVVPLLR